jgi:hypothetical protein
MGVSSPKIIINGSRFDWLPFLVYIPMHEVAPSAVSTAVITDAMICSVHFNVSFFDINSSFLP